MSKNVEKMKGISIIHDQTNDKKYAQIDLELYGEVWEDFYDGLLAELAKEEESYPLKEVIEELETKGNLDKYV